MSASSTRSNVLSYEEYVKSDRAKVIHYKCRGGVYQRGGDNKIRRVEVDDRDLSWLIVPKEEYRPQIFTTKSVMLDSKTQKKPVWADYDVGTKELQAAKWNSFDNLDGSRIDRRSYECKYKLETLNGTSVPLNPKGRTGLKGRGALGRWGPNHAADPIVTRWQPGKKRGEKRVLEFIAIQRRDTGEWAIPGGMVDPGEQVNVTLRREFGEEAMASLEVPPEERARIQQNVDELFRKGGDMIYKGYVDDPRNTDNAWMETDAYNFHDENGNSVAKFKLHAGDDATGVQWMAITKDIRLYASHAHFVQTVARKREAAMT
ncbi:DgyrCDS9570 [Dimorphilus gyrociliatus]|uniref:DgyrCDS9570 n=1 Tax=Dimorphilus gyrociliatus TaxID=2664684 RepID=A0A7I8VXE3_9ANNE|nr:DgyrCDS9570 [Dimorphilus gyrociliatus]